MNEQDFITLLETMNKAIALMNEQNAAIAQALLPSEKGGA